MLSRCKRLVGRHLLLPLTLAAVSGGYTDNPADLVVTALSNGDHVVGMIVGADASSLTIDITLGGLNAATAGLLL